MMWQCGKRMKALEDEIVVLSAQIEENVARLKRDVPYLIHDLSSKSNRTLEIEKRKLRRQNVDKEVSIRLKRLSLSKEQSTLKRLEEALEKRRARENERLAAELKEEERKEKAAKDAAAAKARQRAAKEQAAREASEKAAREAAAAKKAQEEDAERKRAEEAASQAAWEERLAEARKRYQEEEARRARAAELEEVRLRKLAEAPEERRKNCTHTR